MDTKKLICVIIILMSITSETCSTDPNQSDPLKSFGWPLQHSTFVEQRKIQDKEIRGWPFKNNDVLKPYNYNTQPGFQREDSSKHPSFSSGYMSARSDYSTDYFSANEN
ncbi:uncharacterized protein LOC126837302 [Adelges cooleyi]|uniref:uncharacterized protein LOC126837302 n=1 Tax=Adelges cooleyi TaxID=133065 RepID=UPI00217F2AAB|nr:uncharacterized protein LOC126837302 [Adelges cooleyi]